MRITIVILSCLIIISFGVYIYLRKINKLSVLELKEKRQQLYSDISKYSEEISDLTAEITQLNSEISKKEKNLEILKAKIDELNQSFTMLESQAQNAAQSFYDLHLDLAKSKLKQEEEKISNILKAQQEEQEKSIELLKEKLNQLDELVKQAQRQQEAAVEAARRQEEMRTQADFYKIHLDETDIKEIQMIREIEPYLKHKEALNKVIWKYYYENPTNDMIGRVIGTGTHTGIYKITNLINQKCYIGQAVNLSARWKQHIKRALGAETPSRNKLYPAMAKYKPENFSFEIVEECPAEQLSEREKYWTQYFHAQDYGYSIRSG